MLLYCKGGVVVAAHDDNQNVDPAEYGSGVSVFPWAGSLEPLGRAGPDTGLRPDVRPYAAPPATPAMLAAYANWKQWRLATGGYTATIAAAARKFATDEGSLSLIAGKQLRLQQLNPPTSILWQFADVGFVSIAVADFTPAAIKIADFVQSTFDTLKAIEDGIAGGTIATFADVDAAAWPAAHD